MGKEVMHQKFYDILLKKIKNGEIKNGEKIPSERALCDLYDISRTTVREALKNLEYEGYIIRKRGSGSFVQIKPIEQKLEKLYTLRNKFVEQGIKHDVKLLEFKIIKCDVELSKQLEISVDDEVISLIRIFYAADVPYTIEYTFLPLVYFTNMTKEMITSRGLYHTMEFLGNMPERATETIRAVKISAAQKSLLEVKEDILAIETQRISYSDANIIEYTKNVIRNDYFIYTVNLS